MTKTEQSARTGCERSSEGRSVYARCPFYRRDSRVTISCEGLTEQSVIRQFFGTIQGCDIQFETFCSGHYERCELYDAIRRAKYLVEEEA